MDNDLKTLLAELEGTETPQGLQTGTPFTLNVGGKQYTAQSPEEVQRLIDGTYQQANNYVSTLQQEIAARDAELERLRNLAAQTQNPQTPQKQSITDSQEFLETIVEKGSTEAVKQALAKDPQAINEIVSKSPQFQQLQAQLTYQNFAQNHPFYANPQILGGLTKIVQDAGFPLNNQSLEMAAGWAVAQGILPHESVLRNQQRQNFAQQFVPQQQAPQYDDFGNPEPPQYVAPKPPPRTGGGNQQPMSLEEKINQRFNSRDLTTEQMKQMIEWQTSNRMM